MIGVAREVAFALGKPLNLPEIGVKAESGKNIADFVKVDVSDFELCPRYMARTVRDISIGPSPAWMRESLRAAGMRSINNIVDITNYVMLETGQPMHAFDLACVKDNHIVVRRASEGEGWKRWTANRANSPGKCFASATRINRGCRGRHGRNELRDNRENRNGVVRVR